MFCAAAVLFASFDAVDGDKVDATEKRHLELNSVDCKRDHKSGRRASKLGRLAVSAAVEPAAESATWSLAASLCVA